MAVTLLLAPGVDGRQLLPFRKLRLDADGTLIDCDAAMSDDVRAIIEIVEVLQGWAKCVVPECSGASSALTRQGEKALWQAFFTAAPEQRREFEPNSKRRKRRSGHCHANWPSKLLRRGYWDEDTA